MITYDDLWWVVMAYDDLDTVYWFLYQNKWFLTFFSESYVRIYSFRWFLTNFTWKMMVFNGFQWFLYHFIPFWVVFGGFKWVLSHFYQSFLNFFEILCPDLIFWGRPAPEPIPRPPRTNFLAPRTPRDRFL